MPNSKNLTWATVEKVVEQNCRAVIQALILGKEAYEDLLEARTANGATDQLFADKLFGNVTATTAQVALATDAKDAMVAINELYGAMTNVATTTADRAANLRRMV